MPEERYERPTLTNEWPFPMLVGSQLEDWPSLTGLGYPDLSVLDETAGTPEMRVEEFRDGAGLVVRADVPGVDPDTDVQITLSNGNLDLHVVRREEQESTGEDGTYSSTFSYGELFRRIPVPGGVTSQDVTASYEDGLLEIRVPI